MAKKPFWELCDMSKPVNFEKIYKVYIQKTYRNEEGYVFMSLQYAPKETDSKSFTLIFHYKKIHDMHNPMFVVVSLSGDDFKGRNKLVKNFEENHSLEYSVAEDGLFEGLNG